jgi:hypothetical protein
MPARLAGTARRRPRAPNLADGDAREPDGVPSGTRRHAASQTVPAGSPMRVSVEANPHRVVSLILEPGECRPGSSMIRRSALSTRRASSDGMRLRRPRKPLNVEASWARLRLARWARCTTSTVGARVDTCRVARPPHWRGLDRGTNPTPPGRGAALAPQWLRSHGTPPPRDSAAPAASTTGSVEPKPPRRAFTAPVVV